MIGAASSESSHVLCITMVFVPPMKISLEYSSMARLLSATFGTYLHEECYCQIRGNDEERQRDMRRHSATMTLEFAGTFWREYAMMGKWAGMWILLDDDDVVGVLPGFVQDLV